MANYSLRTVWHIEAPLAVVYSAISEPLRWPEWWPEARLIRQRQAGNADGVGRLLQCTWQGRLPYRLNFDLLTTRLQPEVVVEGRVSGDLEGCGQCRFTQSGTVTVVEHDWQVHTTRRWMNLLAPAVSFLFKHNHAAVMKRGGEGLAALLGVRLLAFEHGDLHPRQVGAIDNWIAAAGAGVLAGIVATLAQLVLWWLTGTPLPQMLYRDARLTAAMLLGPGVLPPPETFEWTVMGLATLIHFALSIAYGLLLAPVIRHSSTGSGLLLGGLYGMLIYGINLYGMTGFFPWFAVARDWITVLAHLVFGVVVAAAYPALRPAVPVSPGRM
ncbi:MAG: SRPBCC family protein [Bacteroidota bacterium]